MCPTSATSAGISASWVYTLSWCLVLLFLTSQANAAPHKHRHLDTVKMDVIEWINPCGVLHVEKVPIRHQANYFLGYLKKELKATLNEFYRTRGLHHNKSLPLDQRCMKIDSVKSVKTNLPKTFREYQQYKKRHPKIVAENPGKLIHDWLSRFYERQLGFYKGFGKLIDVKLASQSTVFNQEDRAATIEKLKNKAKSLLCEVETSLNSTGITKNYSVISTPSISGDWPHEADVVGMCVIDESFYILYQDFLKDWQKILNDISTIKKERKRNLAANKSMLRSAKRFPNSKNRQRQLRRKNKKM